MSQEVACGSSDIRRQKPERLKGLGVGAAVFVVVALLFFFGRPILALLAGLAGAVATYESLRAKGEANCPNCGELMEVASECGCPGCRRMFKTDGRVLRELDEAYASDWPRFAVAFPHGAVQMPGLCCACGAPSTRSIPLVKKIPASTGPGLVKMNVFELPMPYCVRHDDGAAVESAERRERSDGSKGEPAAYLALKVKSYGFYRAYLRANG